MEPHAMNCLPVDGHPGDVQAFAGRGDNENIMLIPAYIACLVLRPDKPTVTLLEFKHTLDETSMIFSYNFRTNIMTMESTEFRNTSLFILNYGCAFSFFTWHCNVDGSGQKIAAGRLFNAAAPYSAMPEWKQFVDAFLTMLIVFTAL